MGNEKYLKTQEYGAWDQHKNKINIIHVSFDEIKYVKEFLENNEFVVPLSLRHESNLYQVGKNNDLIFLRRIFSSNDIYPQITLFSKNSKGLEDIAKKFHLPLK